MRLAKVIRRTHLYLGLLLFPWVLLFGVSGMLFNHGGVGRERSERRIDGAFTPWDPQALAQDVVAQLNQQGHTLQLEGDAWFSGWSLLKAGEWTITASVKDGSVVAVHEAKPAATAPPAFAGAQIDLRQHNMSALAQQVTPLLPEVTSPIAPHPRVAPDLRFRVRDPQGNEWNASLDLNTRKLETSHAGAPRSWADLLRDMHKTHHYESDGPLRSAWVLFADLTAMTLVVWALTGLYMWWKTRPTRALGLGAIALALALSLAIFVSLARDILFVGH